MASEFDFVAIDVQREKVLAYGMHEADLHDAIKEGVELDIPLFSGVENIRVYKLSSSYKLLRKTVGVIIPHDEQPDHG